MEFSHTFAVCAYGDSPYLEDCVKSLKRQSETSHIIICTSTPSEYIQAIGDIFHVQVFVRDGKNDIQDDWNFAYEMSDSRFVTIAHQDDVYHKDYAKTLKKRWQEYPDMIVFTTDCAIKKGDQVKTSGLVLGIKRGLRLPLRLKKWANQTWIKQLPIRFGNSIVCPSCSYHKAMIGTPLFASKMKFALDWDTMWNLAKKEGRFICEEKPLICYRIHEEATTKACIEDKRRVTEELAMYEKIWPTWIAKILMIFYKKAYQAYD